MSPELIVKHEDGTESSLRIEPQTARKAAQILALADRLKTPTFGLEAVKQNDLTEISRVLIGTDTNFSKED